MSRNKIYILLALLILFHIINNIIIVTRDNTPFLWDGGDYFYRSLKYYDVFANFDSRFISRFIAVSPYRPPLFLLSSLPLYLVFGRYPDIAVMTNIIYLIVLVLSVYGIGKRLHSEDTGLFASFIVSTFPILFGLSRSYWLDFPLTAIVSLSIYLLLKTDYFMDRRYSLLFGVSSGLGMLTKWTYFIFIIGPFLYSFIYPLRGNLRRCRMANRHSFNAMISILTGMVIASIWYIPNGLDVAAKLLALSVGTGGEDVTRFQQLGETFGPSGIFNFKSLTFYASQLVNHQITFFYAILLVIFTLFLLKNGNRESRWALLLWILVPVVVFTLIKNKTVRNTVPMLPSVGLIIAAGIMKIKDEWVRKGLIVLSLAACFFQYAVTSYGASYLPEKLSIPTPGGEIILFQQHKNISYAVYRANTDDWKADEILRVIDSSRGKKEEIEIVLIPRDAFTWMAMEYTSYLSRMPFTFIGAVDSPESVLTADYVLIKKGGFIAPWFSMDKIHRSLHLMEENVKDFALLRSIELPEERTFLPIYDIKATEKSRKSDVVFSGKLQVVEHSVAETTWGGGREFAVELTLKSLKDIDSGLMVILNFLNRKMEVVTRKTVKPLSPASGWKEGEVKTIKTSVMVQEEMAEEVFSIEMGFYEPSGAKLLSYHPEYLIYKRAGTS